MVAKLISAFFSINQVISGMHLLTSMLSREYKWATEPSLSWCYYSCPCRDFFNVTFVLVLPIHNSHQSANSFWPR